MMHLMSGLLLLTSCLADDLQSYEGGGGGGPSGRRGGAGGSGGDGGLAGLQETIPGVPGEDYPIYAAVPDSDFSCQERVEGGKYADPAAECQVFHFCALANTDGGLSTYSFLCPNGTVFNQEYFICDWWFNVDCAQAESLYSLNDEIAAENAGAGGYQGADGAGQDGSGGRTRPAQGGYGAPRGGGGQDRADYESSDGDRSRAGAVDEVRAAANGYGSPDGQGTEAGNGYAAPGRGGNKRAGGRRGAAGNSYGAPGGGAGAGAGYSAPSGGDERLAGYGNQANYNAGRRN